MLSKKNSKDSYQVEAAAYRLLKVRLRSVKELRERLLGKGFASSLVDAVIRKLRKSGLLDDREFALYWARSRLSKGWSWRFISYELRRKGINKEIEEEVLGKLEKETKKEEVLKNLFEKLWVRTEKEEYKKRKRKIFSFFQRRGFSYSEIEKIWEQYS